MAATDPYQQPGERSEQPAVGPPDVLPQTPPVGQDPPELRVQPAPQVSAARSAPSMPLAGPLPRQSQQPAAAQQAAASGSTWTTGASRVASRRRGDDARPREEVSSIAIRNAPPWLVSAAFHMAVLIVLGLLVRAMGEGNRITLDVETVYAEQLGDQLEFDSPLGMDNVDELEEPVLSITDLPEVDDPFAAPPMLEFQPDGTTAASDIESTHPGLALSGREEGSKRSLLGRYGGNATTEAAVLAGLQWLARNQRRNGSWSLAGPYDGGVAQGADNEAAATAMALLAFQGYGITHKRGRPSSLRKHVVLGWKWLLKEQDADGNFFHEGSLNHRFYTQGMCTIAACELYGMTKDPEYKETAEKAVDYCLRSQSPAGGWRYSPNSDSDVSVTGWVLMALQSAKMAGLEVPEDHFRRVERFLDKVGHDGGSRYPYQRGGQIKLSMTAEALLCRQYLGWARDDPRLVEGVAWLTEPTNLINFSRGRDVYYWYYATQVAHHMEGEYWKKWNSVMRQVLPEQQVKQGRERGSWDPEKPTLDQWAPHGGRLYVTCLSIYMLEVYYRHLPIYTKVYTDLLKSGRTGVVD